MARTRRWYAIAGGLGLALAGCGGGPTGPPPGPPSIVLAASSLDRCLQFASGLAGVLRQQVHKPLLIISSDLNHYGRDTENRRLDALALAALERLDPAEVYATISQRKISMCGLLPAVIVLETLRQLGRLRKAQRVAYATSAEVTGDPSRVVGYAGMLFG